MIYHNESGGRDSNPRLQAWEACTLPLSYTRKFFVNRFKILPIMNTCEFLSIIFRRDFKISLLSGGLRAPNRPAHRLGMDANSHLRSPGTALGACHYHVPRVLLRLLQFFQQLFGQLMNIVNIFHLQHLFKFLLRPLWFFFQIINCAASQMGPG